MWKRVFASAQSDQRFRCPQTESVATIVCSNGVQSSVRDFAHVRDESESVHFAHARRLSFAWHGPSIIL